ncbi:glycoside hydrolase family 43 protein [Gracilibacillus sp. YIM 98692]|uniref:glycoside hydrolase family 43 protein n=1 Tax=Gracilibacillus sp. YIM 98692 TaxID=2663532 RepID=UPI001969CA06|nr:glycoside hydrolase family 43 protein [Gracilibacillus sp. YIM 98692]
MNQEQLKNPILPGFNPDPSICRVEDDFYLVTSSFSMFPGIPIFHSKDLINWKQIGHVLDRQSQLHVTADNIVAGIMAPTLRYNKGTFYVITSNFSSKENFIVTATDPSGPWSDPYWLKDDGIDPSLFFDDDGKVYYTGTAREASGEQVIWISEFDLQNMCFIGEKKTIWGGALKNCASPEAPHLYKKDGYYYLVIAEGGTEHFHAVTVARSTSIFEYFESHKGNPIMTHRHFGKDYPICNVGHVDLVELESGEWYAVMLGSRLVDGHHKNLGRETFIAPVTWEDHWPVISPGTGRIERSYPAPDLPTSVLQPMTTRDDFNEEKLGME